MSMFREPKGGRRKKTGILLLVVLFLMIVCVTPFSFVSRGRGAYAVVDYATFMIMCKFQVPCQVSDVMAYMNSVQEQSYTVANFLETFSKYASIISWWDMVGDAYKLNFNKDAKKEQESARQAAYAAHVAMKTDAKYTDAIINGRWQEKSLEGFMKATAETNPPLASEQYLCDRILACQGIQVMDGFARMVGRMVGDAVLAAYRGEGADGSGPLYVREFFGRRCGKGSSGLKFGSALDGMDKIGCGADASAPQVGTADMDISASILDRGNVLQVPIMVEKEVKIGSGTFKAKVPDIDQGSQGLNDVAEKRKFLAAMQYCFNLGGARPSPPTAQRISKDTGASTARARWERCVVIQEGLVRECADRIGYLSRPDCGAENSDYDELCKASLQACNAARTADSPLPPDLRSCASGASLYQMNYLCTNMCETNRQAQAWAHTSASPEQMQSDLALCRSVRTEMEKRMQREDDNFRESIAAMGDELARCWQEVGQ